MPVSFSFPFLSLGGQVSVTFSEKNKLITTCLFANCRTDFQFSGLFFYLL